MFIILEKRKMFTNIYKIMHLKYKKNMVQNVKDVRIQDRCPLQTLCAASAQREELSFHMSCETSLVF